MFCFVLLNLKYLKACSQSYNSIITLSVLSLTISFCNAQGNNDFSSELKRQKL